MVGKRVRELWVRESWNGRDASGVISVTNCGILTRYTGTMNVGVICLVANGTGNEKQGKSF